ncbi:MAG: glycosyltransferase family 4 protein [Chloroflexi bacterium]|nr:glycosyltransferase family 4 protein [Chloroflexota bacterium]
MALDIAIDGGHLGRRIGGDATYLTGLLAGLATINPPHRITVFSPRPALARPLLPRHPHFHLQPAGPRFTLLRNSVTLPLRTYRRYDVLHVLLYAPPISSTPLVLYLPDLSFLTHPQFFPRRVALRLRWSTLLGVHRATRILTLSETSRRLLLKIYQLPSERICVAYTGVDHAHFHPRSPSEIADVRHRLGLPPRYLLYVGNLHPRKNLSGLLREYALLLPRLRELLPPLVIAGLPWWDRTYLPRIIAQQQLEQHILPLGWVDQADLPAVLCGATALIYPSLVEGFGLPPIEAMACGIPAITLHTSVFPEILDDAAVLANPAPGGLADAIAEVVGRPEFAFQKSRTGLERAARYRWEYHAAITVRAYEQAAYAHGNRPL